MSFVVLISRACGNFSVKEIIIGCIQAETSAICKIFGELINILSRDCGMKKNESSTENQVSKLSALQWRVYVYMLQPELFQMLRSYCQF